MDEVSKSNQVSNAVRWSVKKVEFASPLVLVGGDAALIDMDMLFRGSICNIASRKNTHQNRIMIRFYVVCHSTITIGAPFNKLLT